MSEDRQERFAAYVDALAKVIGHADRAEPLRDYCRGAPSTWLLAACGSGAGRVGGRDDDAYLPQLRWPPLSGRGHQPRGLAVLPLPAQPAHGRGDAGRPRHHRQPQDYTAIGAQVRPDLRQPRRRLPCAGDKWHLDEVAIKIAGKQHWVWRAVDQEGIVLDILVQSRRDKWAAKR